MVEEERRKVSEQGRHGRTCRSQGQAEKEVAETVRTSGVTWIADANEFGIPETCYNPITNYSFCSPTKSVTIE